MMNKTLDVIFFGTPEICLPSLNFLEQNKNINLIHIVSMPDRPAGRGKHLKSPAVIQFAKEKNIKFTQSSNINKDESFTSYLKEYECDLIIVFAFAQFLGSKLLGSAKMGCFNIHTSLLPKYRGAAPIQYSLWNGDRKTGVSIQKMVKQMDAGDIAIHHSVDIDEADNQISLTQKLGNESIGALEKFINNILNNNLSFTQQDETEITFAPTLKKEDGFLDFKNKNSKELSNQVKAFIPWPGCFFETPDMRIKVHQVALSEEKVEVGLLKNIKGQLIVGTKSGSLRLEIIQIPGKKASPDSEFLKGYRGELSVKNT